MINKVGMLIIVEPNIEQAVEFYNKLGFEQKFHIPQKWAEFQLGDIKFGLCPAEVEGDRHTGIVLEIDDLNATASELKKHGISFLRDPYEAVHGIMASIKDPGGNIIDLYQPTPEKLKEYLSHLEQEEADQQEGGCCGGHEEDDGDGEDECCQGGPKKDSCCQ